MQTRIKELETINRLLLDQLSERTTKRTRSQNVSPSPEEDFLKIPKMYYADMNKLDSRKFEEPTFSLMDQRQFN
ncbi:hypothetical protein G6F56_012531 [Rhizopus delemar]|nr:hypothetical protein G6F56_012531 [Rhizopus delemar]